MARRSWLYPSRSSSAFPIRRRYVHVHRRRRCRRAVGASRFRTPWLRAARRSQPANDCSPLVVHSSRGHADVGAPRRRTFLAGLAQLRRASLTAVCGHAFFPPRMTRTMRRRCLSNEAALRRGERAPHRGRVVRALPTRSADQMAESLHAALQLAVLVISALA